MNSRKIFIVTLSLLLIASYSMGQSTVDSTALLVTETGNVGIDNPTPHSKLDVGTNGPFTGTLIRAIGHSNDNNAANFEIGDGGTIHWRLLRLTNNTFRTKMSGDWSILGGNIGINRAIPSAMLDIGTNEPFLGKRIRVIGHSSDDNSAHLEIGDGGTIYWRLLRLTNNTFRTKMSGNWSILGGNIGIGTGAPIESLDVVGNIKYTGKLVPPSDQRLKKNIQKIERPLEKIASINGVSFEWIDEKMGDEKEIGVIAQEVEKVFPEVVATGSDGYKGVDYSKLVVPLIEAVKVLKAENEKAINALKKENESLKKQLLNLNEKFESLN